MKQILLLVAVCFLIVACEKSSTTPTTTVKDCEKNHTATVTWKNGTSSTYNMTIAGTTKSIGASQTATYTGVPKATTQGTCVQSGTTTIVTFPAVLFECETSAFQF